MPNVRDRQPQVGWSIKHSSLCLAVDVHHTAFAYICVGRNDDRVCVSFWFQEDSRDSWQQLFVILCILEFYMMTLSKWEYSRALDLNPAIRFKCVCTKQEVKKFNIDIRRKKCVVRMRDKYLIVCRKRGSCWLIILMTITTELGTSRIIFFWIIQIFGASMSSIT